jgi:ABC-type nitrate/sulfonate/bicarbonate transport system substrate-binding protein
MGIRAICAAAVVLAVVALSGCGGTAGDGAPDSAATLTLDSPPGAIAAGIALAIARDFTGAEGVQLTLAKAPGALSQLQQGRTQFAVADLHELALARAKGHDLVAVMAIVQDPLASLIVRRAIRARVSHDNPPAYPELVLTVTRETLQDDPALVRATVNALQRGYRAAIADPESAVQAVLGAAPGASRAATARRLAAVSPAFQAADGSIGTFDSAALERWTTWEQRVGIVKRKPEVALMFDGRYARSGAKQTAQEDG